MNPPEPNDSLDVLLREQNNYVEDNGFTNRVMKALPARKCRTWMRPVVLLGSVAIGYVLAILWLPWANIFDAVLSQKFNSQTLLTLLLIFCVGGSLLWSIIAAVESEE